ncbi:peptidoglycan-binding protein [Marinobacter vulgaris]|uniref:Peptidoglycan-binding protein n=1 Tax=Marinobacter vulgaris TaxID=1928331 RepID=A0A2V4A0S9_9GAMM|nr:AAA family ATPase [Marinobacter vulgaris]PXX91980.1 peptidoglycan-binding protein [Marinobacter vulgaris]TSJ70509.1 AAA family ATPase [Marinobacter vulgaris]
MYYDFFGFREPPFSIAPDPRYLYLSERHKEALAHLMYGVQGQGGFIVITGEVGTGKTTVSRCFIENVPDHVDIALILNPRLSARELLSSICDELEIPHPVGASIKELVGLINDDLLKAHAAGRHKVLMIDEAQNLSAEVLEQLRLLTNLETAEKKLLQIVLLGQPELQDILELPELRQLNQRVTARYHLDALGREEIEAYLRYRLSVAGLRGEIFTDGAVRALYRSSKGVPRLINLISDRALLGAYSEGEHQISASHIRTAAREVNGNRRRKHTVARTGKTHLAQVAASLVIAIILTAWALDRFPDYGWLTPDVSAETEGDVLSGTIERVEPAPETVPEFTPEPVTVIEESLPDFEFPADTLALPAAFGELFSVWGRDYSASDNPIACRYAEDQGLRCLDNRGSRRSLEHLNRPAILLLRDGEGDSRYAVLSGLDDKLATIELPEGPREVSFASLEPFWFGEFTVLWEVPPHLRDNRGDDTNSDVSEQIWMGSRMMELASRYADSPEEENRVNRLPTEGQIRWYQKQKGLMVDGIAGGMTIIQMNNDLESDGPRLSSGGNG